MEGWRRAKEGCRPELLRTTSLVRCDNEKRLGRGRGSGMKHAVASLALLPLLCCALLCPGRLPAAGPSLVAASFWIHVGGDSRLNLSQGGSPCIISPRLTGICRGQRAINSSTPRAGTLPPVPFAFPIHCCLACWSLVLVWLVQRLSSSRSRQPLKYDWKIEEA
jgi:hypothetical protein